VAGCEAQPPADDSDSERAAYLTLLGHDTLAVEWMEFTGPAVEARALVRGSPTTFAEYRLDLSDDGTVKAYEGRVYEGGSAQGEPMRTVTLVEDEEGRALVVRQGGEEQRRALDGEPGAVPFIDMLHWPFEAAFRWQMDSGGLRSAVPILASSMEFDLVPQPGDTLALVHPSRGPSTLQVDDEGRIIWLDGTGSTRAYDLRRTPWDSLDAEVLGATFADRPLGELSGRGQIDDTVAGVTFTGHYGMPERRGRDIFGGLLAFGEWWRTGANQATHLSFDRDLVMDGDTVPAGDYTLSSIPREDGGTLIINRQTGQGGQSYDESLDEARVEMRRELLDERMELFEIRAVETPGEESAGRLELRWDDTVYWVPFQPVG
jgi:hypothetical protein